jgi:hypothetical protein
MPSIIETAGGGETVGASVPFVPPRYRRGARACASETR